MHEFLSLTSFLFPLQQLVIAILGIVTWVKLAKMPVSSSF